VIIANWNGLEWLPACLESLAVQSEPPGEVIVVDNASTDDSREYLAAAHASVRVLPLAENTGFAFASNRGIEAARGEFVALVNTDVVLAPDWLARMRRALEGDPAAAAVACKMVSLTDPAELYDAGDILRRDGACEQRGRFCRDDGSYDEPGEVFGACAGAALYRRHAVLAVGGLDERYFAYLEDVDLAVRLRLAGWRCRYEPAVARHAGGGSSARLRGGHLPLVQRNTLVLVAKFFPPRWLPMVAYRQLSWAWYALRGRRLRRHVAATVAAVPMVVRALRERRRGEPPAVAIEEVVPARPFRGTAAGGHLSTIEASWRSDEAERVDVG
jgi:GT2 family glycosyltransferase